MKSNGLIRVLGVSVLLTVYFSLVMWILDPFLIHEKGGIELPYFYLVVGVFSFFTCTYIQLINYWINRAKVQVLYRYLLKLFNSLFGIFLLILLLHYSLAGYEIQFGSFSNVSFIVLLSSLLPIAVGAIKERDRLEKEKPQSISIVEEDALQIEIPWYNGKQKTSFNEQDVICLESSDNYVTVYYIKEERLDKDVIRTTLKKVENNLPENSQIVRVHKSYLINPVHIEKITGVSQAYKLRMKLMEEKVPVSRSFDVEVLKK